MSALGWIFLVASLGFVWGLTFWCFYRVLNAPVHIVVDRGRVTLTGSVASRLERTLLGHLARQTMAFEVDNRLQVEGEDGGEPAPRGL